MKEHYAANPTIKELTNHSNIKLGKGHTEIRLARKSDNAAPKLLRTQRDRERDRDREITENLKCDDSTRKWESVEG